MCAWLFKSVILLGSGLNVIASPPQAVSPFPSLSHLSEREK